MSETVAVKYTGTALPTGSTTSILFDTVTAFPSANYLAMLHMKRLQIDIWCSQAGTVNWYKARQPRGLTVATTTWDQLGTQAVTASSTVSTTLDFLVEEYGDFKVEWVNGGVNQTAFDIDMALTDERNKGN
jgi:hypothetical protein